MSRDTGTTPIGDYGLLSDCHSAALVNSRGSIDWWCLPRFDSPSVFGRLLDPAAGHWLLTTTEEPAVARDYLHDSLVLRTVLHTATGTVRITDALALQPGTRGHGIGYQVPHALLRMVDGVDGEVLMRTEVAPRMEYGLTAPQWLRDDADWLARAGPVRLRLTSDRPLHAAGGDLTGQFPVRTGERISFRLVYDPPYRDSPPIGPAVPEAIRETTDAWRSWSALHRDYKGLYEPQVRRSALVLQGLTYQRTGAVIAAATTSLPEQPGADLNWDYRFAWLRDISLTLQALWVAACPHEAKRFFTWLAGARGGLIGEPLQIVYGVTGERDLTERALGHLGGYRSSRPVRVGNDAWRQRQLDVLGEVLLAADLLRDQVGDFDEPVRDLLVALADQAAEVWRKPDSGMWEARDRTRHYTSSKVMCWVAVDRAVALADRLGAGARADRWAHTRDAIRAEVLRRSWSRRSRAFAGAFDSDQLDASVLLLPLVGFLPADDPRMIATIDAVRERLAEGPLLRRWVGDTAGFTLCSFWLVECLALAGRIDEARDLFDRLLAYGNDLGLYAEQIDPAGGQQLGNAVQAFSHVGLINAAWRLTQAAAENPSCTPG
ncbi:MAG TPA: glycoside hydrolase family 15 protein [Micromonosporaceae bacterium]